MEPALPVLQRIAEIQPLGPRHPVADQLAQVALPGDEADDRGRPLRRLGLDQLGQLLALLVNELQVGRAAGQPEDQLVEKQDQPVVAERGRVPADHRQALVERQEGLAAPAGLRVVRPEIPAHQHADQLRPLLRAGLGEHRGFEPLAGPAGVQLAPGAAGPLVQFPEELLVADLPAEVLGVAEQALGQVHARQRRRRVGPADEVGIAAENARLHVVRAEHVVRHEQDPLAADPGVVPGDHAGQLGDRPGGRVALQDQVDDRHEMALSAAETAVQVGGLARGRLQRAADERQGVVERLPQLRRDDVVAQRLVRPANALGKFQHVVAGLDALGNVDQVF